MFALRINEGLIRKATRIVKQHPTIDRLKSPPSFQAGGFLRLSNQGGVDVRAARWPVPYNDRWWSTAEEALLKLASCFIIK